MRIAGIAVRQGLVEMHRSTILTVIVCLGAGIAAGARTQTVPQFDPIGPIQKVRNNLFMIPGQGGNTAVFVTRTGVVLVDTKVMGNGQAILDRVATVSDLPVTTIINTHGHFDHVGSNEFFSPSVEVVAQENTRASMAKDLAVKDKPQAMPDRTFHDKLTIGAGQDQVDLYYFGPAHTGGDAIVVFPAVRVVHTGDLFLWNGPPLVDAAGGGSGVAYPETLEKAIDAIHGVDTVIPGHMGVTNWSALVEFAEFTRELFKATQAAHRGGKSADEAASELRLPSKFESYLTDAPTPGLEFLESRRARVRDYVSATYAELTR